MTRQGADGRNLGRLGKLGVLEVADDRPYLPLVANLTEEPQRLSKIPGRADVVPADVHGERPRGQ